MKQLHGKQIGVSKRGNPGEAIVHQSAPFIYCVGLLSLSLAVSFSLAATLFAQDRPAGIESQFAGIESAAIAHHWRHPRLCGPLALYTVLRLSDIECTLSDVLKVVDVDDTKGASLLSLQRGAEMMGLKAEAIKLDNGKLAEIELPALVHMSVPADGHYVVVLAVNGDRVLVTDPTEGVVEWQIMDEFRKRWSGVVLSKTSGRSAAGLLFLPMIGLGIAASITLAQLFSSLRPKARNS